ncbi:MAG: DUF2851 family protein [Bacteroidales bacterium]
MTEEFLHYLWRYKLLNGELKLSDDEKLEILNSGMQNTDAGPDFFNAKIRIGETLWAGNVEIHIKASDWYLHQHQNDKSYDSIILHVVYQNDIEVKRQNGNKIPTLIAKDYFDQNLFLSYQEFISNKNWIACENSISNATAFIINSWLERLLIERIERKTLEIKSKLITNNNNWEVTFYQLLAKNFGSNLNSFPFELLANSIPIHLLSKHKNSLFQLEALLFGQSGLLNDEFIDRYPLELYNEYTFLRKKYNLQPIAGHLWKLLRLRPASFPAIRISQFADLIYHSQHLFSKIVETENLAEIYNIFQINASEYFNTHYTFDAKIHKAKSKLIGKNTIDLLIINTVVPFLFLYASEKDEKKYQDKALKFLEQIKSEENSIIKKWINIGITVDNAFKSQALLELKNNYCNSKKCLQCSIGNSLLRRAK